MRLIKKKNLLILSFVLPIFLVSLFSCNKKSDFTNVIYFWHNGWAQSLDKELERKIDEFQKIIKENEGVDVVIQHSQNGNYDELPDRVLKGFATGASPTITIAYPDHVADYLSHENSYTQYVYNLEPLMNDSEIGYGKNSYLGDEYDQNDIVDAFFYESKSYIKEGVYSIPFMKSTEVLVYNKDIVEDKLIPTYYPEVLNAHEYMENLTWDQFIDMLRIVKEDIDKTSDKILGDNLEVPLICDSDENLFITKMYQNDIPFVSIKDGQGSIDFNNDKAKAVVKRLKEYYDDGLLLTKSTNNNIYSSNSFKEMKCLFTIGSSGGAGYNDPGVSNFNCEVVKVPYENEPLYVTQGPTLTLLKSVGVSDEVNDFRKEYGWKFIKYITNTTNDLDFCLYGSEGYIPVRESSYKTDLFQRYLNDDPEDQTLIQKNANVVINDINGSYFYTPAFKGSSNARTMAGSILTQVFLNKKTIDEAFKDAENEAKLGL